jgi:hypothetical protein
LAEAFINMIALLLCKKDIRTNPRQYESFIKQNIDVKVFDFPYKCEGFSRGIAQDSPNFVNFKRIMDNRNHVIHGNVSPEREKIEVVYFDDKTPLFMEGGDNIGNFMAVMEQQHKPEETIKNYTDMHLFFEEILSCLRPELKAHVQLVMADSFPGYDVNRKIVGSLLPEAVITGHLQGVRYDDELA